MNDQEYILLKNKILKLTRLDIDSYKQQQMRRRLDAYVLKQNTPSVAAFCEILERNPEKQREILDYMAINVSEFFRDIIHFNNLKKTILPSLMQNSRRLNIWSAACSSGQEPFTLAIILDELSPHIQHRIVATDIDESALKQARNGGPYTAYDVRNVEKSLLEKYFITDESNFFVKENIRNKIVFKHHNLLCDPFENNYDLIICRNVIIYFSEIVRDILYTKFWRALKNTGVLFLGGSEVVLKPAQQGYRMLSPSFYKKAETNNTAVNPGQEVYEVKR
ncbi:MAG TPA: protein-glutamate O-methyltransferase CheR [Dehalococcoidales bacterium]|nr:protein-glutamate O-methyltransferase CheR [Dehalococcoidales bacterium]